MHHIVFEFHSTCNLRGNENAYGDQCEKCGSSLNPTDLINPRSALSGAAPVLKETKNWFLPMGDIQQSADFQNYIKRFEHWKSNIKGQCNSWLNEGLQPRAMTRDLDWGVPVPLTDAEGKVLYVWFDAPIGYISATKEYFEQKYKANIDSTESVLSKEEIENIQLGELHSNDWKKYWQSDDAALIHFIGKDNIVFHAIIFPMMLLSHGGYVLPHNVPANEFLNLEGDKISTSRNWAVWLHEYLEDFPGREDELRYVLTSNMPETKDNDFIWKYDGSDKTTSSFQAKVNNELVAVLGNFVNRVMVLTWKFFDGKVPTKNGSTANNTNEEKKHLYNAYIDFLDSWGNSNKSLSDNIKQFRFRDALSDFINLSRAGNKYLAETEPWKLFKNDPAEAALVLNTCLQMCANLSTLCEIFLPNTAEKIAEQLNLKKEHRSYSLLGNQNILTENHQLNASALLFKPIEDADIDKQLAKLEASKQMNTPTAPQETEPAKPEITFDDFAKTDIRVGTILEAERVPKTDKLLKLKIDTGLDQRTVVSGIAEYHKPEDIIGQQVCILINLAPRKMKGIESQGMILMAKEPSGKLVFVAPATLAANGSGVA